MLFPLFAPSVIDTGGKFAGGVVDTDGKLPPVICRRYRWHWWQICHRYQQH